MPQPVQTVFEIRGCRVVGSERIRIRFEPRSLFLQPLGVVAILQHPSSEMRAADECQREHQRQGGGERPERPKRPSAGGKQVQSQTGTRPGRLDGCRVSHRVACQVKPVGCADRLREHIA